MRQARSKVPILLDCDAGVDDSFAVALTARHPASDLQAISVVGGNVPTHEGVHNVTTVLELSGAYNVPVLSGVDRGARLGSAWAEVTDQTASASIETETFTKLRDIVFRHDGRAVLVATGPLTNVAVLLKAFPEVVQGLNSIVFLGGAFGRSGNITPVAEHNVFADPEAASAVFESGASIKIVPLNVSERFRVGGGGVTDLHDPTQPLLQQYLSVVLQPYLAYYRVVFGIDWCPIHDPLAVMLALEPQLFRMRRVSVSVELEGRITRGLTVADLRPEAELDNMESLIEVAEGVDDGEVWSRLTRLTGLKGYSIRPDTWGWSPYDNPLVQQD
jgi:inosine-uridine nucleoside N-ribohydrolase